MNRLISNGIILSQTTLSKKRNSIQTIIHICLNYSREWRTKHKEFQYSYRHRFKGRRYFIILIKIQGSVVWKQGVLARVCHSQRVSMGLLTRNEKKISLFKGFYLRSCSSQAASLNISCNWPKQYRLVWIFHVFVAVLTLPCNTMARLHGSLFHSSLLFNVSWKICVARVWTTVLNKSPFPALSNNAAGIGRVIPFLVILSRACSSKLISCCAGKSLAIAPDFLFARSDIGEKSARESNAFVLLGKY